MKIDKELIRNFSRGKCSKEEAEAVQAYFDEHPDELENYFPLNDWLSDSKKHLVPTTSERMQQQIRQTYEQEKPVSILKVLSKYIMAASMIGLMIFGGVKLLGKRDKNTQESAVIINSDAYLAQILRTIENRTNAVMEASLPDGSLVTMYPRSSLNYLPQFEKDKRELYLKGKAFFKVSKDRARPFTVYAGGIATTALGTQFMVSELEGRKVLVALLEGSIKVSLQKSEKYDFVILQPGDKLVVNSEKFNSYTLEKKVKENIQDVRRGIPVNTVKEKKVMVFKNDRLKEVFKKIEERYMVTINYEADLAIEKESFTGKFEGSDSLEFICKTICKLHGLQYRKDGNVVTISKL